jgi:hypothetical protein
MADKNTLIEQMLEHLVNDEQQKAEELFHEYVVAKSREIYESLIEEEMKDEDEDESEEDTNESFEEIAVEADEDEMDLDTEDPTDDLAAELGDEGEDDDEEKDTDELFQDLEDIVDELQAKFDQMNTGDMDDMEDEEMKDDFDLETVREYVEKVPAGHGAEKKGQAEKADGSATGMKFSKNDMGGQPMKFGEEDNSDKGTAGGLSSNKAQDMKSGNVNVPGGKASDSMSKTSGHGAEKKGAAESADNTTSLFRGRR